MALRLFRHIIAEKDVGGNDSEVLSHAPLPGECVQNNVWGEVHVVNNDGFFLDGAMVYGADGFVVPHPDPDTVDSVDDLWDRLISVDVGVAAGVGGELNLDTTGAATGAQFEIGELNLNNIIDMAVYNDDHHWFKYRKILSFANTPTGFHWVTGGVSTFSPTDLFKVRSRRNIAVEVMSESLFGVTIPALTGTTSSQVGSPTTKEWFMQKYLEVVLEQAWMHLVGLSETGAETPWEDAALFLEILLEPPPHEADAAAWFTDSMRVWASFTFDITVPGRREFKVISGE